MSNEHWQPHKHDQEKGLCTFESPDLHYRFYAKWSGDIHFWFNENPLPPDIRERLSGIYEESDYYWYVGGLEELDAIKATAQQWFAERGKRWPPDWDSWCNGDATTIQQITQLPAVGQD